MRRLQLSCQAGLEGSSGRIAPRLLGGTEVSDTVVPQRADRRVATTIAMLAATVSVTIGDLIMSRAMRHLGPLRLPSLEQWWAGTRPAGSAFTALPGEVYDLLWLVFGNPQVWLAIGCMLTFLVLWMVSLSWADLTFVMPLTALTYVLNAILVGPALGEHVSPMRWVGTVMITAGVALVTLERSAEPEKLK